MSHSHRPHRLLPALVAGLAAPAHARPADHRGGVLLQGEGEPFSALWTAIRRLWQGPAGGAALRSLFGAEGATLDPHGGSTTGGTGGTAPTQGSGTH